MPHGREVSGPRSLAAATSLATAAAATATAIATDVAVRVAWRRVTGRTMAPGEAGRRRSARDRTRHTIKGERGTSVGNGDAAGGSSGSGGETGGNVDGVAEGLWRPTGSGLEVQRWEWEMVMGWPPNWPAGHGQVCFQQ